MFLVLFVIFQAFLVFYSVTYCFWFCEFYVEPFWWINNMFLPWFDCMPEHWASEIKKIPNIQCDNFSYFIWILYQSKCWNLFFFNITSPEKQRHSPTREFFSDIWVVRLPLLLSLPIVFFSWLHLVSVSRITSVF